MSADENQKCTVCGLLFVHDLEPWQVAAHYDAIHPVRSPELDEFVSKARMVSFETDYQRAMLVAGERYMSRDKQAKKPYTTPKMTQLDAEAIFNPEARVRRNAMKWEKVEAWFTQNSPENFIESDDQAYALFDFIVLLREEKRR